MIMSAESLKICFDSIATLIKWYLMTQNVAWRLLTKPAFSHSKSRSFTRVSKTTESVHSSFRKSLSHTVHQCICTYSIPACKSPFSLPRHSWKRKEQGKQGDFSTQNSIQTRCEKSCILMCFWECQESHCQENATQQGWQLHHKAPQPVVNHSARLPSAMALQKMSRRAETHIHKQAWRTQTPWQETTSPSHDWEISN